ncbi:MAG: hypothetical protein ACT4R6_04265 [Gemmatimonadaceae bacterium]
MTTARELLRHTVATVAYRAGKALRGAPRSFAGFRSGDSTRSPLEILAHMGDLFDWALELAKGGSAWRDATPLPWDAEVERFFAALGKLDAYLASEEPLGKSAEQLFQGPVADALTHTGQLTILRRLAGSPIRGENYARADIAAGSVQMDQRPPNVEFD